MSSPVSTRVFGGCFGTVSTGNVVRFNIHDRPEVIAAIAGFSRARITSLSVFGVPSDGKAGVTITCALALGHCEHAYPTNLAQMAQLPGFSVGVYGLDASMNQQEFSLDCPLSGAITSSLKPVELEGGRPSIFARVVPADTDVQGPLVDLFYRITIECSGVDIVIV